MCPKPRFTASCRRRPLASRTAKSARSRSPLPFRSIRRVPEPLRLFRRQPIPEPDADLFHSVVRRRPGLRLAAAVGRLIREAAGSRFVSKPSAVGERSIGPAANLHCIRPGGSLEHHERPNVCPRDLWQLSRGHDARSAVYVASPLSLPPSG